MELRNTGPLSLVEDGSSSGGRLWYVCNLPAESELGYKLRSPEFCYFSGTATVTLSRKGEGLQIKITITSKRLTMLGTCSNSMRSQVERKPCRT